MEVINMIFILSTTRMDGMDMETFKVTRMVAKIS